MRILGIPVSDPVEITELEPPSRYAIRHLGLFAGDGLITLEAGRRRLDDDRPLAGAARAAGAAGARGGACRPRSCARSSRPTSCASSAWSRPAPRPAEARATTTEEPTTTMQVHLVDATYELFRAHFAPRPPVLGRDDKPLSGVSGLVEQLLFLLREQGATHVGCATDRVIRSFRNDLFAGLQDRGRDAARAARPVPDRRAGDRGAGARAVVDARVRGGRRDRRRGRPVRRRPARRAGRDLHARTRTWPSWWSTSGSSCGTGGAT